MRYFISTLNSSGFVHTYGAKPIFTLELLSISITKESGESLTLLSKDFSPSQVEGKYLQAIVDSGAFTAPIKADSLVSTVNLLQDSVGLTRPKMKKAIQEFVGASGYIYGYQPFQDFVILDDLIDIKQRFFCHDLKQMGDFLSESVGTDYWIGEDSMYPFPSWKGNYEKPRIPTSLEVSKWCRDLYLFMEEFKSRNNG